MGDCNILADLWVTAIGLDGFWIIAIVVAGLAPAFTAKSAKDLGRKPLACSNEENRLIDVTQRSLRGFIDRIIRLPFPYEGRGKPGHHNAGSKIKTIG